MNIIENNPFRVLGVISNSSPKEAKQSETFILRYLDIGKSANLQFDITPPLNHLERTSEIVKNARRQIHNDFDKLTHSVFWFVNGSTVDKIALDKLSSEKNIDKALESFRKGSRNFLISKNSFSSILNFSTLEIISYNLHKDEERLKNAIKYKYQIINDNTVFNDFEKLITSSTDKIDHKSFLNKYIENTKVLLKEIFPKKDLNKLLLDVFSEDKSIIKEIHDNILSDLVDELKKKLKEFGDFFNKQTKKSDKQIIKSKSTILSRAKKLFLETKSDLKKLKKITGKDNFQFTDLANEVYSFINGSVIMCYNKEVNTSTSANNPYIELLELLTKEMSTINCTIKSTIIKNLSIIKDEKGSSNCWFCNGKNECSESNPLRIQMYMMTGVNNYSYFKDGGLPLDRCSSCNVKHSLQASLAFIVTLAVYLGLCYTVIWIFFVWGDLQNGFAMFNKMYHFFKNTFSFVTGETKGGNRKSVRNHPIISQQIIAGYYFGKP